MLQAKLHNFIFFKIFRILQRKRKGKRLSLHNLHVSPNIFIMIKIRSRKWAGHVARMGKSRNAHRVLVGKPEGKRPLERP
jgi:hypothetical protein